MPAATIRTVAHGALLAAMLVGLALFGWASLQPAATPVAEVVDARPWAAALLVLSSLVIGLTWFALTVGGGGGPRRRPAASLIGAGTAVGYGGLWATLSMEGWSTEGGVAIAAMVVGLLIAVAATAWWGSIRAIPVALAGAWLVAAMALAGDVAWQLSGPYVAPFDPCIGGMDCIGKDPEPPLASGWTAIGAVFGMLWFGGLQLAVVLLAWIVRAVARAARRPGEAAAA